MHGSPRLGRFAAGVLALGLSASVFGGFAATECFLPAVGRVPGKDGAQFYTTVWATNLTAAPLHFTFDFLKAGQANPNPAKFTDTLAPGETKVYENVVQSKLGLTNALGAARIVSDGEILVAERIYDQAPGAALGDTEGLFFAGVPKNFSISAGQSASIQGINQGGSEDFRYNFALVETGGGSPTVNVQVFDGTGALLGQRAFPLSPYEQLQPGVGDVVSGIHTTNARITATVTEGTGSVLLAGAQVANVSQDSSGFEMSFRDDILGSGGGTAGVTSLNGLTGALTIAHGANTTVNVSGKTITIDAVTGGGGLTLPYAGTTSISDHPAFSVTNTENSGVYGKSGASAGVWGEGASYGVLGSAGAGTAGIGVYGNASSSDGVGVFGFNNKGTGIEGNSLAGNGIIGETSFATAAGVQGQNLTTGTVGYLAGQNYGVFGSSALDGVDGRSSSGGFSAGVHGEDSSSGVGVYGETGHAGAYAIYGNSHGASYAGYFDGDVHVNGTLSKLGGSFKIDHPLDPAHKYLSHSFVESPDMKNIYDGVTTLDTSGTATITLPDWFEALNRDFRYQLTAIGTPQPSLYVAQKVSGNTFRIAGGVPGAEVSWMVTGIRHDAWADAHRIPVEEIKPEQEQGTYLEPALFGEPEEKSVRSAKERERGHETLSKPDEIN